MKNFRKIFVFILLTTLLGISSIFAEQITFNISKGETNSLKIYDEFGVNKPLFSKNNIPLNQKLIIRTFEKPITIDFTYGILEIADNSIITISPNEKIPLIYIIDGQITLETNSVFVNEYNILTPVSKYNFKSPAKINVISNEDIEYGLFYEGRGTSYNALTNKTTEMFSAQLIDMANNNNIKLDVPQEYLSADINIENNDPIISLIQSEYNNQEKILKNKFDEMSKEIRNEFLNNSYVLGLNPVQKSNSFDQITTINLIVTGNGQGNISYFDLPSFSGIINTAREENKNILLIDAGNTLRGSTFVNFDKGKTATKILDMIGYDIFVPGAIDFSNGISNLQQLDSQSNINFISSNALNNKNELFFNPYGLYLYDNFKIAVLGLSSPSEITDLMGVNLLNDVVIENAQKAIDAAKEIADYVILVSNLRTMDYNSTTILNNITGIDLLIDGSENDAIYTKINNIPVIKTGVGYSEIQNLILNVKNNEILSVNYAKAYASNLSEDDNNLLKSLDLNSYTRDINLSNYLSMIKIPNNLSNFLISPIFESSSTVITDSKDKKIDEPTFVATVSEKVNKVEDIDINKLEEIANAAPVAPTIISNSIEKTIEIPNKPTFISALIEEIKPLVEVVDTKMEEEIKEEVSEIQPPNYKPISYKVRKQESLAITNEVVQKEETTEEPVIETRANIYSDEDNTIKTNIGLNSTLDINVDVKDSTFINNDYKATLTLKPYISRGGFSLGLKTQAYIEDDLTYDFTIYPLPTSGERAITEYTLELFDYLKFNNSSDTINIDINRNTYEKKYDSALAYTKLGGDKLHLTSKFDMDKTSIKLDVSNLNIFEPYTNETLETAILSVDYFPVELFEIDFNSILRGNRSNLDIYPSLNLNAIAINNKDIKLVFNLGATAYIQARPSLNFTTFIDPTSNNLIPNYLINTGINIETSKLNFALLANYLVTEDNSLFTTNLLHKATTKSIFQNTATNTLSAIGKVDYHDDNLSLNMIYTIPFKISDFSFTNDLIDFECGLKINDFIIGAYFLQNDFINHVKDIANIKGFFINSDTELGGYLTYNLNNFTFKANLAVPSSSTIPLKVGISVSHKLNFAL